MIRAADIAVRYAERNKWALSGVSFQAERGESVLVLGPSGSGKSTLALCLDGLIPHVVEAEQRGRLDVDGLATTGHPVATLAQRVGVVFQDPESQFCTLTVEDEVAFGLENLLAPPDSIDGRIAGALEQVGLDGFQKRRLDTLSGGQKQRVALASVLALDPAVLVLDEPSANLDPAGTREIFAALSRLAASGERTIVIVEHRLDEIIEWVDRVLALSADGGILFDGGPREAFHSRAKLLSESGVWMPQSAALVQAVRKAGWRVPGRPLSCAETVAALEETPGLLTALRGGSPAHSNTQRERDAARAQRQGAGVSPGRSQPSTLPAVPSPEPHRLQSPVMRVEGLGHSYGKHDEPVLHDVSCDFHAGELVAIAGENGAGKSTLVSLLTGVLRPPRRTVFLHDRDIRDLRDSALTAEVGYVFQNPEHQFVTATVAGELAYSLLQSRRDTLTAEQHEAVREMLARFGLETLAEADPYSLSQGQKRRLSVAAMLVRGQSILFLDEPTFGQDREQATRLMHQLRTMVRTGRTVVMVTHDMGLVAEYAERLLVLKEGRLLYSGTPAEFFACDELMEQSRLERPALARMGLVLRRRHGLAGHLLTLNDVLSALGALRTEPDAGEPAEHGAAAAMAARPAAEPPATQTAAGGRHR